MVIIYTSPGCGPCVATKRALDRAGIAYEERRLADHPEAVERFRAAGHVQAPVVVAGERVWSGFHLAKIQEQAREAYGADDFSEGHVRVDGAVRDSKE